MLWPCHTTHDWRWAFPAPRTLGLVRSSNPLIIKNTHLLTIVGLENESELLSQDLSSVGSGSDASLTPPIGSRSITSSPPRGVLTPEQRELKRQQDLARRDSKSRARRTMSGTGYPTSSPSPPVTMSEFGQTSSVYTTAPSQISLLAEPVTTVGSQQYIPAYSTSPPLSDHGPSPMFSPHHYPSM